MLINSYAVLLAFVAALRLGLGILLIGFGLRYWLASRWTADNAGRERLSDRYYLLALMALLLLMLNLISWPLFYALLQSYVSEIPGVMCIYGVTRVGEGSSGSARHLPTLAMALQLSKPILMFVGGAWFILHLLNRRTGTDALLIRLILLSLPLGIAAIADSAFELTYLALPKAEEGPNGGCCTVDRDGSRYLPAGILGQAGHDWLCVVFIGGMAVLVLTLYRFSRPNRALPSHGVMLALFAAALLAAATGWVFLVDVAAPRLLGLPFHHCPYDLPLRVPESIVAIVLFLIGCFGVGWASVARTVGSHVDTTWLLQGFVGALIRLAIWCYCVSVAMLLTEMFLA